MKVLLSKTAVREQLWVLLGLDQLVTGREEQLVDQDATTGRWGFPDDISTSARGHVPDDRALALQRAEDELVRRALARGCDRDLVGSVFGVTRRNTFHKQYRAAAYAFPLDEFNRGGRPAEPDTDSDEVDEPIDPSAAQEPVSDTDEEPAVPDGDRGRVETWGGTADEPGTPVSELLHDDEPT